MAPVQEKQLTEKRTHIETESCIVKAGRPGTDAEKNRTPETEADHAQDIERSAADRTRDIERSIIKRFRKEIWRPFVKALNEYQMIQEGDRIAVCISGGKDSMLLAKCMQEILRHGKMQFGLEFLVMDPGYRPENRSLIEENAGILGIPVHIFQSDIFQVVSDVEDSPCYLCARMRRGNLYANAKELGCNKIALGHHFDDVIETILMSMLYGAQVNTMMPKLHSTNFPGMELIRPLYLVKEADILAWKEYNHLRFLQCACRFTEESERNRNEELSKRKEMKRLISGFRKINPYIDTNIFKSVGNVNLDACIGYVQNGVRHHFLETYDNC
ncbi:MAG TPA: tRNA 2-thiocytidine biosynthesis protein TtcA [Candidatus Copromonas faecavium]|uniref:tRNA 2-thiocytidine biosynthesis protein TtcA n=1 Tax=Candidatus Copromonas faecavium (nom. illeg.) TaxID=2840740 RepID=A0A9D1A2D0_9FIRM|nr:tRNA 2-thiocytidine biosynthesis protein TtcA [Candidatus Copromonas faecavium]